MAYAICSTQYFYFKLPFYRIGFVKELIVGALAKQLLGEKAPQLLAVELSTLKDSNDKREYGLASQSLGAKPRRHDNLENWAQKYELDDEELQYGPKHLGVTMAFKLLLGDSDIKTANIILLSDGSTYPIDNEYTFDLAPTFIGDAESVVNQLLDYANEQRVTSHIPLQAKKELLEKIRPVLQVAIQQDLQDGSVIDFYQRFASLTEEEMNFCFDQYGTLISHDDRQYFLQDLKKRQQAAAQFVKQYQAAKEQAEQQLVEDMRKTLSSMRGI